MIKNKGPLYKILVGITLLCGLFCNAQGAPIEYGTYGRLISYPNKIEVPCPAQTKKTGVLLAIGQSNIANHGQSLMTSRFPNKILNYYNGKCYLASSPLLGATGAYGEFLTPLGDYLVELGVYDQIIIISSAIGATHIALWEKGGELNDMLIDILKEVQSHYSVTEIIWHQGEADFIYNTSPESYKKSFNSLVKSLREDNKNTPFYYAIATKCGATWYPNNPISLVQRELVNNEDNIFIGADTDTLVTENERPDSCHFTAIGQYKAAYSYAMAIFNVHNNQQMG